MKNTERIVVPMPLLSIRCVNRMSRGHPVMIPKQSFEVRVEGNQVSIFSQHDQGGSPEQAARALGLAQEKNAFSFRFQTLSLL